jgi:membrane protein
MFEQMKVGEIRLVASSLAFSTLLALVPFFAVTLFIFKEIGGIEFLYPKVEAMLLSYLAPASSQQAIQAVKMIIQRIQGGAMGSAGAVALFVTSFRLIHEMEYGINRVWNIKDERKLHHKLVINVLLFFFIPLCMALYISVRSLSFLKPIMKSNFGGGADLMIVFLALFFLYKMVPRLKVKNKPAILSSLLATLLLWGLKSSFTWLTALAFNYSKVYGSLATIPLLCLWILAVWYILLAGVAFCASTQKRNWLDENYGFDFTFKP